MLDVLRRVLAIYRSLRGLPRGDWSIEALAKLEALRGL